MWPYKTVKEAVKINKFYSFFSNHYKKGYNFNGESHNFWECLYVIDGGVCVSADEKVYNLSSGEIIFHKPLEMHKFFVNNEKGALLLIFSFEFSGEMTDYFENKVFKLFPEQRNIISSMLDYITKHVQAENDPQTISVFLEPFEKSKTYSQVLTTYVHQLFLSLAENERISENSHDPHSIIFEEAVNYMKSQIHTLPTVSEIAKNCNVSISGLKRIFLKYSGISVHKYFLTLKINTAANMLKNGESVSEVAEKLNFSSQGYFSKTFKRETGINPSQII